MALNKSLFTLQCMTNHGVICIVLCSLCRCDVHIKATSKYYKSLNFFYDNLHCLLFDNFFVINRKGIEHLKGVEQWLVLTNVHQSTNCDRTMLGKDSLFFFSLLWRSLVHLTITSLVYLGKTFQSSNNPYFS